MSADVLLIDSASSPEELSRAAGQLRDGHRTVMFERRILLRAMGTRIMCEIIDPERGVHRCAEEFQVMIENARSDLSGSRLGLLMPRKPLDWRVVMDEGAESEVLWRA